MPRSAETVNLRERMKEISGHNLGLIAQIITALDATPDMPSEQEEMRSKMIEDHKDADH